MHLIYLDNRLSSAFAIVGGARTTPNDDRIYDMPEMV